MPEEYEIAIVGENLRFVDDQGDAWEYEGDVIEANSGRAPRQLRIAGEHIQYVDDNQDIREISREVVDANSSHEARQAIIDTSSSPPVLTYISANTGAEVQAHGDASHTDDSHVDQDHVNIPHDDESHRDRTHQDDSHTDTGEGVIPHDDRTHIDSRTDNSWHTDLHDDQHEDDSHVDRSHVDDATHIDTFSTFPPTGHEDRELSHTDRPHDNLSYTDVHANYHSDNFEGHNDTHTDTHGDRSHTDDPHDDISHEDTHGDRSHTDDSHEDTTGVDESHTDISHRDEPALVDHGDHGDHSDHGDHADHSDFHSDIGGGPGCFLTTATANDVETLDSLRRFRDEWMKEFSAGQQLVDFYYHVSPPIAETLATHPDSTTSNIVRRLVGICARLSNAQEATDSRLQRHALGVLLTTLYLCVVCVAGVGHKTIQVRQESSDE